MKILKNELKNELNLRTEKDYPIKGIEFIDIMPVIMQNNVYSEIINKFVEELKDKKIDYIVSPEARGFLFGCPVANRLNIGCVPVRKKGKIPSTTVAKEFMYEKEYGKDILVLPNLVNDEYKNKKFYIVDDIYATGNTVRAIKKAIEDMGGIVEGIGVVMNIVELNSDENVYSMIDINEE